MTPLASSVAATAVSGSHGNHLPLPPRPPPPPLLLLLLLLCLLRGLSLSLSLCLLPPFPISLSVLHLRRFLSSILSPPSPPPIIIPSRSVAPFVDVTAPPPLAPFSPPPSPWLSFEFLRGERPRVREGHRRGHEKEEERRPRSSHCCQACLLFSLALSPILDPLLSSFPCYSFSSYSFLLSLPLPPLSLSLISVSRWIRTSRAANAVDVGEADGVYE